MSEDIKWDKNAQKIYINVQKSQKQFLYCVEGKEKNDCSVKHIFIVMLQMSEILRPQLISILKHYLKENPSVKIVNVDKLKKATIYDICKEYNLLENNEKKPIDDVLKANAVSKSQAVSHAKTRAKTNAEIRHELFRNIVSEKADIFKKTKVGEYSKLTIKEINAMRKEDEKHVRQNSNIIRREVRSWFRGNKKEDEKFEREWNKNHPPQTQKINDYDDVDLSKGRKKKMKSGVLL